MSSPEPNKDAGQLGGQTLIVFGGNLFTLLLGFPFQIYLARTLGAEQLGHYGLVEAAIVTISGLLTLGIAPTAVRFIPEHLARGEYGDVRRLMLGATLILMTVGAAVALLIRALAEPFIQWWEIAPSVAPLVSLMALTAPIGMLTFLYQQILRGFHEILVLILTTSVLALTLKIAVTVWLLGEGWGVEGYAVAVVASGCATLSLLALAAWRLALHLPRSDRHSPAPTHRWIRYAAVMYASALFGGVTQHFDRFLVGALLGPASVAILMIVKQLQQLPTLFHQAFLLVVAPMFAAATAAHDIARHQVLFHMTTDWVMRLALPMLLFLAVFAGPMLGLYGEEFRDAGVWLLLVGLAASVISFGSGPTGNLLLMSGEEAVLLRYSVLSTAINLSGYFALIPIFGLIGVGFAQLAATLFLNGVALVIVRRRLGVVWASRRYRAWIAPGLLALSLLLAIRTVADPTAGDETSTAVTLGVALLGAYAISFVAGLVSGLHDDDRAVLAAITGRIGLAPRRGMLGASE